MVNDQLDRCPQGAGAPEISLLEARSQASEKLPCKTIYRGIRTCTRRHALCFQLEIRFRDKGQASVGSTRLPPTSGAYTPSQEVILLFHTRQGYGTPGRSSLLHEGRLNRLEVRHKVEAK